MASTNETSSPVGVTSNSKPSIEGKGSKVSPRGPLSSRVDVKTLVVRVHKWICQKRNEGSLSKETKSDIQLTIDATGINSKTVYRYMQKHNKPTEPNPKGRKKLIRNEQLDLIRTTWKDLVAEHGGQPSALMVHEVLSNKHGITASVCTLRRSLRQLGLTSNHQVRIIEEGDETMDETMAISLPKIRRFKYFKSEDSKQNGRQRAITGERLDQLKMIVAELLLKTGKRPSAVMVRDELAAKHGFKVCDYTVRRTLNEIGGLNPRPTTAKRKPNVKNECSNDNVTDEYDNDKDNDDENEDENEDDYDDDGNNVDIDDDYPTIIPDIDLG